MATTAVLLDDARRRLAGAPREGLGVLRTSRWRKDRIVRAGDAWHLGVLLLTDDAVLATGEILRAAQEVRRGYTAESARARAAPGAGATRRLRGGRGRARRLASAGPRGRGRGHGIGAALPAR